MTKLFVAPLLSIGAPCATYIPCVDYGLAVFSTTVWLPPETVILPAEASFCIVWSYRAAWSEAI